MVMRTKIINAILVISAVLIVIFAIVFLFYQNIYQQGIFKTIPQETEQAINDNFVSLIDNLNSCIDNEGDDCYCQVFPNFPAVLPTGSKLQVITNEQTNKTQLLVLFDKQRTPLKNQTVDFVIKGMNYAMNKHVFNIEGTIDFSKQWPLLLPIKGIVLVSDHVYKNTDIIYFIFSPSDLYENVLNTIRNDVSKKKKCE
jgi:hypothetical protein